MKDCNTCKHDGNQTIFKTACTGCGVDAEYGHYESMTNPNDIKISDADIKKLQSKVVEQFAHPNYVDGRDMIIVDALITHYQASRNMKHIGWYVDYASSKANELVFSIDDPFHLDEGDEATMVYLPSPPEPRKD